LATTTTRSALRLSCGVMCTLESSIRLSCASHMTHAPARRPAGQRSCILAKRRRHDQAFRANGPPCALPHADQDGVCTPMREGLVDVSLRPWISPRSIPRAACGRVFVMANAPHPSMPQAPHPPSAAPLGGPRAMSPDRLSVGLLCGC
jgi:hypothetical protein